MLDAGSNSISEDNGQLEEPDSVTGITLLEAALLSGSRDVAHKALKLEPDRYDVGALCAASLTTSNTGDYTIIRALIENRPTRKQAHPEQKHKEMTAIGIAAYKGDWELFQLVRRHLPWSNQAIIPRLVDFTSAFELDPPLWEKQPLVRRFWNTGLIGSIQVFAVATASKIFDLFFDPGYPISSMALNRLVQLELHDQIATLSRRGYQAEHIYSYAKTVSPLHAAVWQRDTCLIRACSGLGLDVNGFERDHRCLLGLGDQKFSCLTLSICQEDWETANLLLVKGGDVNSPPHPDHGMTPLQAACIRGHIGMVMRLLKSGADPDAPGATWAGRTALEAAAEHGRLDIVNLLLRAGVKTDGVGRKQYISAVLFAHYQCHIQVQELLESHREWTEEDRALWNDPDLPYYSLSYPTSSIDGLDGSDSFEQQQEQEEIGERDETEMLRVQDELSSREINEIDNSEGTAGFGRMNGISVVYDGPIDESTSSRGDNEHLIATIDPFIGYERTDGKCDMQAGLTWDDLDFI